MIYFLIITTKKIFTRKREYKFSLISVGNIKTGGTGKTLLVVEIIKSLSSMKNKIAVISSVYKKENGATIPGDEVKMMQNVYPDVIFSGEKNPEGLKKLESQKVDIVIIDDGFHCYWAKKDLDILLIDCSNPFDNKLLIPSGLLREPVFSIKRADIFVLTNPDLACKKNIQQLFQFLGNFKKPVFFMRVKPFLICSEGEKYNPEMINNKKIFCFAGTGNPFSFFSTVQKFNPKVMYCTFFPDHFHYRKRDIEEINEVAISKNVDYVITTEKDYVKLKKFLKNCDLPIFYLKVEGEIENRPYFDIILTNKVKLRKSVDFIKGR